MFVKLQICHLLLSKRLCYTLQYLLDRCACCDLRYFVSNSSAATRRLPLNGMILNQESESFSASI